MPRVTERWTSESEDVDVRQWGREKLVPGKVDAGEASASGGSAIGLRVAFSRATSTTKAAHVEISGHKQLGVGDVSDMLTSGGRQTGSGVAKSETLQSWGKGAW